MTATLYTGGKAVIGRWNLFRIHCGATQYGQPADYPSFNAPWLATPGTNMDVTSLTVLGKHPGSDGNVWIALPDNSEQDMTVTAPADHYSAGATAQKYKSHFEVFVRQPWPDLQNWPGKEDGFPPPVGWPIVNIGLHDAGHAWWRLSCGSSMLVMGS